MKRAENSAEDYVHNFGVANGAIPLGVIYPWPIRDLAMCRACREAWVVIECIVS